MKKTLSIMIMAAALLLMTQCRKEEMPAVMPEANTVRMTVTAGPGSKTDISAAGAITWSPGDKLYVGYDSKYVGYLTLVSSAGSATGTFSGDVALTGITDGTEQTFHFYYLGSAERTLAVGDGSAEVDFSSQNIYNNDGKLENANAQHVGYGSASGTVKDGVVTGINVTMVSKVALARFSFTEAAGKGAYTGPLTLSGTGIYNSMTVGFDGSFIHGATAGNINLGAVSEGISECYVMLVPAGTDSKTLNFGGGDMTGSTKLENGIEANKFYGRESAIAVTVKPVEFTVGMDGETPRKVKFAPGNLYWDGTESKFKFEENQWSTDPTSDGQWNSSHVSHFFWSNTTDWQTSGKEPYASSYSYSTRTKFDVFFTNSSSFQVAGETAGTWRTLSKAEWNYLLDSRTNASSLRAWKELDGGTHKGLVILPDGTENPSTVMSGITSTSHLATSGAVFLPAAGRRNGADVYVAGSYGNYWSGTPYEDLEDYAYCMYFYSGYVYVNYDNRNYGFSVRLVR